MWFCIEHVNKSEGYCLGSEKTKIEGGKGDAFKEFRTEYGRCVGKVYIDKKDGSTIQLGWVFEKKERYTDTNEEYLCERWISRIKPEHYIPIDGE